MIEPISKDQFMYNMRRAEKVGNYSESTAERFYNWMYGDQGGTVQVCAFPVPTEGKTKQEIGEGKWDHVNSLEEFKNFCDIHSGLWRYHVYSGVNTLDRKPGYGRGSVEHINRVKRLSFDIETKRESYTGAPKEDVWWTYKYAIAQIKFMSEEYSVLPLVVMSENGIHLHFKANFLCEDEYLYGKQHICSKYITYRAKNCKYVHKVKESCPDDITLDQDDISDPARVMKVAGTKGIKSDEGRLCGIIHEPPLYKAGIIHDSQLNISQEDIEKISNKNGDSEQCGNNSGDSDHIKSVKTKPESLDNPVMEKVERLCRNDTKFSQFWEGDISGYKSRSEAEFAFILKLLNYDFTEREVCNVMWASGMSKWDEEDDHYRKKTMNGAINYFDGTVVRDSEEGKHSFSSIS